MGEESQERTGRAEVRAFTRERVPLRPVERGEHSGFVIPHHDGAAVYRGTGPADYACGRCATLLAVGVRRGMFRTLVFACACGAMNAVD